MKARKPIRSGDRRLDRFILAAFFVSGVAGLMHEVVWAKLLVQLIGATAYAQAVALAVFMGGLALGSVLFGRRADRSERPLRTYVILEVLIGGYCLLLPLLVELAGMGYVSLATQFFDSPGIKIVLRFGLVILLVLFPAVLMGGTLPILARRLISRVEQTQRQVANLYALNSMGAVLGAGLAGFVTLPFLGIYPSLAAASLLNFAAGGLLWGPARRETPSPAREGRRQGEAREAQPGHSHLPETPVRRRSGGAGTERFCRHGLRSALHPGYRAFFRVVDLFLHRDADVLYHGNRSGERPGVPSHGQAPAVAARY